MKLVKYVGPFHLWPMEANSLLQLDRQCLPNQAWDKSQWESYSLVGIVTQVAWIKDNLAGYMVWRPLGGQEAEILKLGVDPFYRQAGIATTLLKQLSQSVNPGSRLFLELRLSNHKANQLYTRLGYTQTGRRKNYYQNPVEDALLLEKQT